MSKFTTCMTANRTEYGQKKPAEEHFYEYTNVRNSRYYTLHRNINITPLQEKLKDNHLVISI